MTSGEWAAILAVGLSAILALVELRRSGAKLF